MVNFVTSSGEKLTIMFMRQRVTVGRGQFRESVRCEVMHEDGWVMSVGVSLCHPVDEFDARKGAHLALGNALREFLDPKDLRAAHKKIDTWFN